MATGDSFLLRCSWDTVGGGIGARTRRRGLGWDRRRVWEVGGRGGGRVRGRNVGQIEYSKPALSAWLCSRTRRADVYQRWVPDALGKLSTRP